MVIEIEESIVLSGLFKEPSGNGMCRLAEVLRQKAILPPPEVVNLFTAIPLTDRVGLVLCLVAIVRKDRSIEYSGHFVIECGDRIRSETELP